MDRCHQRHGKEEDCWRRGALFALSGVSLWFGPKFPAFLGEIPLLKQGHGLLWQAWGLTQSHLVGKDLKVHQVQPLIMCIFCLPV